MGKNNILRITILLSILMFSLSCKENKMEEPKIENPTKIWVTGYLPGWRHSDTEIPFMKKDDYQFLTHIIHFAVMPKSDGTLNTEQLKVKTESRKLVVEAAHDANKPILISIVDNYPAFNPVIENPDTRKALVDNLISLMEENSYDGIDLDMEPVCAPFGSFSYQGIDLEKHPEFKTEFPQNPAYESFVKELRQELDKRKTPILERPLLTVAMTYRDRHIFGKESFHKHFDQINLMTYDMCGPQDGDATWFDSPLYCGDYNFPKYDKPAYSIKMFVDDCLKAGIPAEKLGIGICMDALVWKGGEGVEGSGGITQPRQTWTKPPIHPHQGSQRYSYAEMMEKFYKPEYYHWDETAQVPYLSIDNPGSADDMFISFNDERSVKAKIDYVRERGIGGFIIWELAADYRAGQPEGKQRPLRKAMWDAVGED